MLLGALGPASNRLVLHGLSTLELVAETAHDMAVRRPPFDALVRAVPTIAAGRMTAELESRGFRHVVGAHEDTWQSPEGARIVVDPPPTDTADPEDAMVREYATLLTRRVDLTAVPPFRVVTAPVQLALWLGAHLRSGDVLAESNAAEDAIDLMATHPDLPKGVAALPPELRTVLAERLSALLRDDALEWVVARALASSRTTPGLAGTVVGQIRRVRDAARPAAGIGSELPDERDLGLE